MFLFQLVFFNFFFLCFLSEKKKRPGSFPPHEKSIRLVRKKKDNMFIFYKHNYRRFFKYEIINDSLPNKISIFEASKRIVTP